MYLGWQGVRALAETSQWACNVSLHELLGLRLLRGFISLRYSRRALVVAHTLEYNYKSMNLLLVF